MESQLSPRVTEAASGAEIRALGIQDPINSNRQTTKKKSWQTCRMRAESHLTAMKQTATAEAVILRRARSRQQTHDLGAIGGLHLHTHMKAMTIVNRER